MALELSSIVFKATTDELDAAVKKIETLGKSVEGLATSLGKLDKASSETNKTQANLINAKAEKELAKAIDITDKTTAATEKLTKATKERQSVEERQAAITRLMAEGNSRGQASILATAEALGEATEKTNEYLKAQRAMSSNNPFDRSLGAATVFANELKVATVASDLYNKDLGFTKNQLQELGREHVRLTEQFKVQGKSLSGLDAEFNKIVQSAQQVTQAENAMAASMKNADKAAIDAGKANAYIENELQKVRFALQANNEELNRSTSNSLVRFENALKKSGLTLDQQRVKIDEYRKSQIELQKTQKANQTDYITRAVGPQITDIVVGLSTGQSPLTVMMQQGGQLRDQFGMMGIAAKDMGDVMRNAMKGMAQSVFDTGKAIGTMLVGGIYDAGKAVVNLGMNLTGMNSVLENGKRLLAAQGEEGFKYIGMLTRLGAVITGVVAVGLTTGLALLVSFGVGLRQVIEQESALNKAMALSGASLGLTQQGAIDLASAYAGAGGNVGAFTEAITESAKAGSITQDNLQMITSAAIELEKVAGVKVAETIKSFAKLGEEPAKEFAKLAAEIGTITPEVVALVYSLEQQGEKAQAATIATAAYSAALKNAAGDIRTDMGYLESFFSGIGGAASSMWDAILNIGRKGSLSVELDAATAKLQERITKGAAFYETKGDYAFAISNLKETVRLAQEQVDKEKALGNQKKENAKTIEATTKWEDIKLKNLSYEKKEATEILKIRQAGAKAGISEVEIQQQVNAVIAKRPKPKKEQESELQKAINKAKEDYIDIQNKVNGVNKEFNNKLEGQQLLLKEGVINTEEYKNVVVALVQQQKFFTDGLAEEAKQLKIVEKAWEDTNKAQSKKDDDYIKAYDSLKAQSAELKNATSEIEFQFGLLGKSEDQQKLITREHKLQNDLREVQVELEKELQKIREAGLDPELEIIARENAAEKIKAINAGVALQAAQDMMKEFDAIKSSITDVVTTALFDGGKAGSKKLRDQVVQAFRNKITVVIDAVVNTALGSLLGGSEGSTGGLGGTSSGGGILGAISTGKSFVDALSGSMNTAIASSFGKFASSGMGQSLGLSNSASIAGNNPSAFVPAGGQLTSMGSMLQGAMASAAGIAAGLALNKAISGGYSVGKGMDNWQKVGTVIAGAINPALGAIVGAIGGLVNRAFGRKLTETGIQGTFGGEAGFTGQNYKFEKGGWFRSDKTSTSAIDPMIQSGLAQQFNAIKSSVGFMATMLGQGTDAIENFTASIKVNFKDLSEEDAAKKLQEEFDKITEGLASLALGTTKYNRTGETSIDTLTRLHTSLLTANSALSVLGGYMFDISLVGANASQTLIDLMGGVQQFTSTLSEYYQNFYTEEERTATATANLASSFAALNIEMPAINESTREWYRSEVQRLGAMDLSVESNAKAYASVLSLQGQVSQLAPAFDSVAQSAAAAAANMTSAWANVMQARGVASNEVTRFTAQADISSAFAEYKKTDKAGIVSAEQFLTISQDDFKLYSSEQQRLISTIISGFASIDSTYKDNIETVNNLNNSYQPYTESIKEVQAEIDKSIQATADYQMAMWEATGDTASAAIRQRELAEATKLAAGWTQSQIDNLYGAQEAAAVLKQQKEQQELVTQATKDYQLAIWEATGDTASATLRQRELATATKLAAGWTQSQIDNLYGAQEAQERKAKAEADEVARAQQQASNSSTLLSILAETYELTGDVALAESTLWWQRVKELNALREADPSGTLGEATLNLWKLQDAAKALAQAKVIDDVRHSWKSKLTSLTQDPVELAAERQRSLLTDLSSTTDTLTQALIRAVYAQEDLNKDNELKKMQAQLLSDYNRALLEAQGDTSGLAEFDRKLSDAALIAAGWTQVQVDAVSSARASTEAKAKADALVQVQSDYTRALLEASGDTSGLAEFDRKLSDAALITAGWTQAQVKAVNAARNTSAINAGIGSWQEKVNTQSESGIALNRIIQLNRDLANAMSDTERGLINQFYANEDLALAADKATKATDTLKAAMDSLETARVSVAQAFKSIQDNADSTQKAVDAAKESITSGYLSALDQQTQAQETINGLIRDAAVEMKGFSDNIKEFLLQMATTDLGADSKLNQLSALLLDFNTTAGLARGGDKAAYGSITGKASNLLSAGKEQFSTLAEFARFSSNIGNTLSELQTLADGKAGPLAEAIDPMIKAQADLLKANAEVALWSKAISESGASTSVTLKDYALEWRTADAANRQAQAELKEAQLLTKDIDLKLLDVLGELKVLIASYNEAKAAVVSTGGVPPESPLNTTSGSPASTTSSINKEDVYSTLLGYYAEFGAVTEDVKQLYWTSSGLSGVPSFAVGTNSVPTDMLANIHAGERIIPAADNTELMQRLSSPSTQDNSELVLEIQRLNTRLATIESNTASTAGHAAKTARLLDRAMPDGDALATRTADAI